MSEEGDIRIFYNTNGNASLAHTLRNCLEIVGQRDSSLKTKNGQCEGGKLIITCRDYSRAYCALREAFAYLVSLFDERRLVVDDVGGGKWRIKLLHREDESKIFQAAAALLRRSLLSHVDAFAAVLPLGNFFTEIGFQVSMLPLLGCDDATPPITLRVANDGPREVTSDHLDLPPGVTVALGCFKLVRLSPGESVNLSFPIIRGNGQMNARFMSVTLVSPPMGESDGTSVCMSLVGNLSAQECIRGALRYIRGCSRLCVDLNEAGPHVLKSLQSFLYDHNDHNDYIEPKVTIDLQVSEELLRCREECGRALAETSGHRLQNVTTPLDSLENHMKEHWGFSNKGISKFIQLMMDHCQELLDPQMGARGIVSLCEGPGSYPQWLLYRTRHHADVKIFGFTLQGSSNDEFRIPSKMRGSELPIHRFTDMSGSGQGCGDVTNPWMAKKFIENVHADSLERGVQLVTADGALSENALNQDESVTLTLIASEIAVALALLQVGGVLICKLFQTETPSMVTLLYQASKYFQSIEIVKPLASRSTNSEKYLICKGFYDPENARLWADDFWYALSDAAPGTSQMNKGIIVTAHLAHMCCVPRPFLSFLCRVNTDMARRQAASLKMMLDSGSSRGSKASRVSQDEKSRYVSETFLWKWGIVDVLTPSVIGYE